ncbi:MAG: AI-2E family transporter [Clostridia bacterium]|nr:AI-2E family transporter [Clostridia bacterium]
MKFLKKYSSWIAPFLFLLVLIIVYKSLDNLNSLKNYLYSFLEILKPFFVGFLIAYIVNLPAKKLENFINNSKYDVLKKHSKGISIFFVFFTAIIIVVITVRALVPELYSNVLDLYNNAPAYINKIMGYIEKWQHKLDLRIIQPGNKLSAAKAIEDYIKSFDLTEFSKYAQGVINITSGVINTFISFVAAIYMLIDKQRIVDGIKNIIAVFWSEEKSESICGYFGKINDIFSKYIYCRLIDALIITVLATAILYALRVKYALVLGLMVGFLNLIPYFGSIISTILVMIISLVTGGIFKLIWTGITLTILQQVDGNYIGPTIMDNVLEIRPLTVIFAVAVGGGFFGVLGMLFSVPIAGVIKMMCEDFINKKRIEKGIEIKYEDKDITEENREDKGEQNR